MTINHHSVVRRTSAWLATLSCSLLLAACGGGGGSPGTSGNGSPPASKATSVILTVSSDTISSSGLDGTEVTLTAIVKDANNNALAGEKVDFKSDSGNISNTTRTTDANGAVIEKLNVKGDPTARVITITASSGALTSAARKVTVVPAVSPVPVVVLATSSDTLQTAVGASVAVTVLVKDNSNNVVPNADVTLTASSGELNVASRKTDVNGVATATLSSIDTTVRAITLSASANGSVPVTRVVQVVSATPTMLLTASSGTLAASGAAGSEVSIVALVKDANNAVVANAKVSFASSSGALSSTQVLTDAKGIATVTLGTGTDPTTRIITVTATTPGTKAATVQVNVSGTKLTINASRTINLGTSTDMTVTLADTSGAPLTGRAITFSSLVNPVTSGGSSAPATTNASGQVILRYAANSGNSDVITVSALGETASTAISINSSNFTVGVKGTVAGQANIVQCYMVEAVHKDAAGVPLPGTVTLSTSRGTIYGDPACKVPSTAAIPMAAGVGQAYLSATGPGVATVTATASISGASVQGSVEFVAPLTASAVISVQADPAVVGANQPGASTQQASLRAVVTDGSGQSNVVKDAKVVFSILTDPSGGYLTQPSESITNSDGVATVSYVAGASATAINGVKIQAQILSAVSAAASTVQLTVAKKSLFISAGTGSAVVTPNTATYQVDYAVFVTDAAGNAVSGVNVTASVLPRNYYKGVMTYLGIDGPWQPTLASPGRADIYGYTKSCPNEDVDGDGVLGPNEDKNFTGRLEPGIPLTITSSGKTDGSGSAIVSLVYPRDRAVWLDVDITIRGTVSGSEAKYVGYTLLPGLAADFNNKAVPPPGRYSPYGQSSVCTDTL